MKSASVVTIGGGTGTSVVVASLRRHPVNVTTIVSVADSGGSTGRLRDEFGFQPVGDLRQALASLAATDGHEWISKLLLYRFENGNGLSGHNVGNLILTALQDLAGSTPKALAIATKIFRLDGTIYPVTSKNVELVVEYTNGTFKIGEHLLDEDIKNAVKIKRVLLSPRATIYPPAAQALKTARLVVVGPGDHYASVMASLAVSDIKTAFKHVSGKVVYIVNLMTRFSQTHQMTARDHIDCVEKRLGRPVDHIIINCGKVAPAILRRYAADREYPVVDDLGADKRVIRSAIASDIPFVPTASDTVKRSLLRHDQTKLGNLLFKLL